MLDFAKDSISLVKRVANGFGKARAAQSAASLAYYALFSIFPLLLVLTTLGSLFIKNEQVYQQVLQFISQSLPVSQNFIVNNLEQIIQNQGPVGIFSILTLIWSASSVFTNLVYNINLAWPGATRRNFFQKRLIGIGMIGILFLLTLLSLVLNVFSGLTPSLQDLLPEQLQPLRSVLWTILLFLTSWLLIFLFFAGLYRWVPTSKVSWQAVLWGAGFSATIWSIAVRIFTWYVNDVTNFSSVYGSLSALVALMLLAYIFCLITLLGAHVTSAIDRPRENGEAEKG